MAIAEAGNRVRNHQTSREKSGLDLDGRISPGMTTPEDLSANEDDGSSKDSNYTESVISDNGISLSATEDATIADDSSTVSSYDISYKKTEKKKQIRGVGGTRGRAQRGGATRRRGGYSRKAAYDDDSSSTEIQPPVSERSLASIRSTRANVDSIDQVSLPQVKKRRKNRQALSKEEIDLRRSESARKRKAQAYMKAEEVKINTIHKLLREQVVKRQGKDDDEALRKLKSPCIKYVNSKNGSYLCLDGENTEKFNHLITIPKSTISPTPRICSVNECGMTKIYHHPKTGLYACNYEHYKRISNSDEPKEYTPQDK